MNDYPMPVFQNTAAQQQGVQSILNQGNQLAQMAGQMPQGGFDPMKMAQMLRKGGTQLSADQMNEIKSLGSNPMNQLSGYNTGMFGWGNYGE